MRQFILRLAFAILALQSCVAQEKTQFSIAEKDAITKKGILKAAHKAAEWQLNLPFKPEPRWNEGKKYDWVFGTFYSGLFELYKYSGKKKYLNHMLEHGKSLNWEPRARPYDGNEYAMVQVYADLFKEVKDTAIIDKSRFMAKMPLIRYVDTNLKMSHAYWQDWWSWCDALFMAPPAFAKLAVVLDEPKYMDYMSEQWWKTSDYLYSKEYSLYFRDDTFFDKKTKDGTKPIFWSRGNGWVIAGLVRVLNEMPADYKTRKKFEKQFVEMSKKIAEIQSDGGYWSSSLLAYDDYPAKETSGTAFFCYGLAWGINNGLLSKKKYYPVVEKAWKCLMNSMHDSGKLGYVQQIGHEPGNAKYDDEQAYGVGALLMASVEMSKLVDKSLTVNFK